MSERRSGRYSMLQKIQVECKTCEITESFYSRLSVEQFKVRHAGHEVVEATDAVQPTPSRVNRPAEAGTAPQEDAKKVSKVIVSMEASLALGQPLVRLRGFGEDLEEAFSTTLPYDQAEKAREILSKGEFLDVDETGRKFVWDVDAVEYELDAKEMLAEPAEQAADELAPEAGSEEGDAALAQEQIAVDAPEPPAAAPMDAGEQAVGEFSVPVSPVEPLDAVVEVVESLPPLKPLEEAVEPPAPMKVEEAPQPQPEPVAVEIPAQLETAPAVEPPAQLEPAPEKPKAKSKEAVAPQAEQKDDGHLLLSKSWYIQGGARNKDEAVRVSKVLKEFRWRVEPIYTIGVILEDMMSIETSRNQISRTLIGRVEGLGYKLTAVTIEQNKPVAWFRKQEGAAADESELDLEADLTA